MIERWFHCRERGSTWGTEVLAGVSTFLALSYIFVVNPSMLAETGMSRTAAFFATVATSAAATLAMGLWTNLPFVLAPGMEINTYVTFYAVAQAGLTWQQALGAVFWSGVLFLLFTLTGIRQGIIDSLPAAMTSGLAVAVGALLAGVAFRVSGVLAYDRVLLRGFGSPGGEVIVLAVSTLVAFTLAAMRVRAALLISIAAGSVVAALLPLPEPHLQPLSGAHGMLSAAGAADLSVLVEPGGWSVVLVLFLVDFYGSVAKLVGLIRHTSAVRDGKVPRLREALVVDGAAATAGSLLGTTSVLVYAESGVGIAAGGRTGLTAVTAGLAMLVCFGAAPLLAHVPLAAAGGALLYVAYRLFPARSELLAFDAWELAALTGMSMIVIATFALHLAILFGLAVHLVRDIFRGVRLNAYAIGSTGLLLIGWVISR